MDALLLAAAGMVMLVGLVAGVVWYSIRIESEVVALGARVSALEARRVVMSEAVLNPEAAPAVRSFEAEAEDVVGQWAEQMAAAGFRVDTSEVLRQRRLREEAGL